MGKMLWEGAWDGVSYARPSGLGEEQGIIGLPPAYTSPERGGGLVFMTDWQIGYCYNFLEGVV